MACPVLFEALPPQLDSSEEQWQDHLDLLDPLRGSGIAAVNVPEIVNGHYVTVEPRTFAAAVQRRTGAKVILNRITVHHTAAQLKGWVAECRLGHGIQDFVFVGGESGALKYPGLPVVDALTAVHGQAKGGRLGVITIPTRRRPDNDEPQRILAKARAGASFAISQILCEADSALALQRDVHAAAAQTGTPAPQLYWSLAPVARNRDIGFLKWLGVHVPPAVEEQLRAAAPERRLAASTALATGIARRLLQDAEQRGLPTPGFCIEHVMLSNVEAAIDLVAQVRAVGREFKGNASALVPAAVW